MTSPISPVAAVPALVLAFALAVAGSAFTAGDVPEDPAMHGKQQMQGAAADQAGGHDMQEMDQRMPMHVKMMDHPHSKELLNEEGTKRYKRSLNHYEMPDVMLRDQTGKRVAFSQLTAYGGPILLNFIFTSCATICPVMSATFGQTQDDLAMINDKYRMISISIDPEYDTPRRLRAYAKLHDARPNWEFLTGGFEDIFKVVRAFDAIYKADNKMYHRPLTFLRRNADAEWVRLEGLLSSAELAAEYNTLLAGDVN
jgi:cytochrome oxidase Cu insertion factor (SCO1/SenC/PrrC family)